MGCKRLLLPGLFFLLAAGLMAWAPVTKPTRALKWVVSAASSLQVNGSTNLNTFTCEISAYNRPDTLEATENANHVALAGTLTLDLNLFDCRHPVMTRDLRKTLKAQQYPQLCITFLSLNRLPNLSQKPERLTGWVIIELAGVRKRLDVKYQISTDSQGVIHLVGTREVVFADFNLVPPTKFKGMVKTKENLTIAFHLKMKAVG